MSRFFLLAIVAMAMALPACSGRHAAVVTAGPSGLYAFHGRADGSAPVAGVTIDERTGTLFGSIYLVRCTTFPTRFTATIRKA